MIKINLDKSKKYLLACSYGPDSMALFDVLLKGGYDFEVAHVNYGLRPEANDETAKLQSFCENVKVKFNFYKENKQILSNIEEKCREIRYFYFKKIIDEHRLDALLVAHNQDDNIETYFLQRNRNNIVEHYGLQKCSKMFGYSVIRPLLNVKKDDLQAYNDTNGVPYAIDSSNLKDNFLRNRIRHNIVQKMDDKTRKDVLKEIKNLNKDLSITHSRIKKSSYKDIDSLLSYSLKELAYHFTIQCRKFVPNFELSLKQVKEFRKMMLSEKPNIIVNLGNSVLFIKSYKEVEIKKLPKDTNFIYILEKPCKFECEYFALDFTEYSENRNVHVSDYPIKIRNAYKSDRIAIKDYFVTMRRQFINWKMPKELRSRWPIILNNKDEIIYVPKYDTNFKPNTKTNFFVKI